MSKGKYGRKFDGDLEALYRGPAFLIRRAHQIATAIFSQKCGELDLKPSQFSVLFALNRCGSIGQNELGRLVSLDRCTTSVVIGVLSERGLTSRLDDPKDRRKIVLRLTTSGRHTLTRAQRLSIRAGQDLLSVFSNNQARTFVDLLEKFNRAHDRKRPRSARLGHSATAR